MSTDCELLELAAKAAGPSVMRGHFGAGECWLKAGEDGRYLVPWNPLDDDGDALRLAVKLQLAVCNEHLSCGSAYCLDADQERAFPEARSTGDNDDEVVDADYAATRRAIVLAAAEIGRSMP